MTGSSKLGPLINKLMTTVLDKENDDPDTIALKKFNQSVKEDKRVDTIILEIRDGLTLCRKI